MEPREFQRVPLFTRVDLERGGEWHAGHTLNIGEGGLSLYIVGDGFAKGDPIGVRLQLPDGGDRLNVRAAVAWVGRATAQGERMLGVRFADAKHARIRALVTSFRYRIIARDFPELATVRAALGDDYEISTHGEHAVLHVVSGAHAALRELLDDGTETPILLCAPSLDAATAALITGSRRVVYQRTPLDSVSLRALGRHLIESHLIALDNAHLRSELAFALERVQRENQQLLRRVAPDRFEGIIGTSAPMQRLFASIERVAATTATVLVNGETGSGKELVARAIHQRSPRAALPFLALNCAGLSESLADTELFGHVRGAFTDAQAAHTGIFETADSGTLFLDEVAELSLQTQAKLLRVLQEGEVRRVGANTTVSVDVRVICATNRDLARAVKAGRFREDLYYRLASFVLIVPPLRERVGDIAELVAHVLADFSARNHSEPVTVSDEAMRLLEAYDWPGNVRQLQNALERLTILSGTHIDAARVKETLTLEAPPTTHAGETLPLDAAVTAFERDLVLAALRQHAGVIAHAATALGVNRTTLSKRCKRLGIAL